METTELLKKLDVWTNGIAEKLLLEAVDQGEAIIPSLIAAVEEVAQNPEQFLEHPERNLYYWAAYLLAHFEEPNALGPLMALLRFDGGKYEPLVDDLFDDGALLLANTAGENFLPIMDLAQNGRSENQRLAAIDALGLLCSWGALDPKLAAAEFEKAIGKVVEEGSYLGAVIANAIIDLNLREAAPAVQAAYDRKAIDLDVSEWEYFADWLHDEDFPTPPPYVHIRQSIDDIVEFFHEKVKEMSEQGAFDDAPDLPEPLGGPAAATHVAPAKVGRNDPCPCGSGKKYKKCCGA